MTATVCATIIATTITNVLLVFLLLGSAAQASRSCDEGCPATTPFCCVLMDSTMCCPYGTTCDSTYGCVLEDRSPKKEGSSDGSSDGSRTPLHEAITSVYLTFAFAGRMLLYALAFIATGFVVSCLHTTVMIKLQNWHRRRQEMAEERESSDEDVSEAEEVDVEDAGHHPPQQSRRGGSARTTGNGDESELQPLTSSADAPPDRSGHTAVVAVAGDGEGRCMLCSAPINCVLLKCGHAVVCYSCARSLRCCPKCDEKIHRRQKLFMV